MNPLATAAQILATVVAPVFVLVGAGWLLARRCRADLGTLVNVNLLIMVPAFVFVRIVEAKTPPNIWPLAVLFTAAIIFTLGAFGWIIGRLSHAPLATQSAFRLSVMFHNCGNFGLPVVILAFGNSAADVHIVAMLTVNIITFSVGVLIASGHATGGALSRLFLVLRQPSILALTAAVLVRKQAWNVQEIPLIWQPLRHAADGLIGIALITLGVQLAQRDEQSASHRLLWPSVVLRLVGGPLLAWGLCRVMAFDASTSKVLILGASAPTAVNTALLAHKFGGDAHFASRAVFVSTLASILTVTVVLTLLRIT